MGPICSHSKPQGLRGALTRAGKVTPQPALATCEAGAVRRSRSFRQAGRQAASCPSGGWCQERANTPGGTHQLCAPLLSSLAATVRLADAGWCRAIAQLALLPAPADKGLFKIQQLSKWLTHQPMAALCSIEEFLLVYHGRSAPSNSLWLSDVAQSGRGSLMRAATGGLCKQPREHALHHCSLPIGQGGRESWCVMQVVVMKDTNNNQQQPRFI